MLDKSFQEITSNIKNAITKTQLEIMTDANKKLVNLYYNIGKCSKKIVVGEISLSIMLQWI